MNGFGVQKSQIVSSCFSSRRDRPNKALHLTAIPLRSIAAGELER
jgi:hypothetical protein